MHRRVIRRISRMFQFKVLVLLSVFVLHTVFASKFPSVQYQALHDFYNSAGGQYWNWRPPAEGEKWYFGESINPCAPLWQGINCSDACTNSAGPSNNCGVTILKLSKFNLTGIISSSIENLTTLETIDLSENQIYGEIPTAFGNLRALQFLNLRNVFSIEVVGDDSVFSGLINIPSAATSINTIGSSINTETSLVHLSSHRRQLSNTQGSVLPLVVTSTANTVMRTIPSELGYLSNLTYLDLSRNGLNGSIPIELYQLPNIQVFNMQLNSLTGTIPSIVGQMQHCKDLLLNRNDFNGTLPTEIGNLVLMENLLLSRNSFTGTIPTEFGQLGNMVDIEIYINRLHGTIPSELGLLTNLAIFSLGSNAFQGSIPMELYNLTNLIVLSIQGNALTGTISSRIGNFPYLGFIGIYSNLFVGSLPTELGKLQELYVIVGFENSFSGTIPSDLFQIKTLVDINFESNYLTGTLPSNIGDLAAISKCAQKLNSSSFSSFNVEEFLTTKNITLLGTDFLIKLGANIGFSENHISGTVPVNIANLNCLAYLLLSSNSLSGRIPSGFGKWVYLEALNLDTNEFTGKIPSDITHTTSLKLLALSSNQLTGELPKNYSGMKSLIEFECFSNSLTGTLPSEIVSCNSLETLILYDNSLKGTIPDIIKELTELRSLLLSSNMFSGAVNFIPGSNSTVLTTIDLSDNGFSGTIPSELFLLSTIETISLNKNCFHGTIPDAVCYCNQTTLTSLALNGLSSGDSCREPISNLFKTYTASFLSGSIPACIFSVSSLLSLQISGNGLTGTLPDLVSLPSKLENITASHNRLHGTIPPAFTSGSVNVLDIGNNEFTGTCDEMGDFFQYSSSATTNQVSSNSKYLGLYDNRLSGKIPIQFRNATSISILTGNIFGCKQKSEFPVNDPDLAHSYCGTSLQNSALIAFSVLWLVLAVVVIVSTWLYRNSNQDNTPSISPSSIDSSQHRESDSSPPSIESQDINNSSRDSVSWDNVDRDVASISDEVTNFEIRYFIEFLSHAVGVVVNMLAVVVFVLVPVYLGIKYSQGIYSTHSYQYAMMPSVTYLSGTVPIAIVSILCIILSIVGLLQSVKFSTTLKQSMHISVKGLSTVSWQALDACYSQKSRLVLKENSMWKNIQKWCKFYSIPACNLAFILADLVVMTCINWAFVFIILTQSDVTVLISEFAFAFIKVAWNNSLMPWCLTYINKNSIENAAKWSQQSQREGSIYGISRGMKLDVQIYLGLFNILISPISCLLFDSENCFLHVVVPSQSITSTAIFKTCHVSYFDGSCVDIPHTISTTFVSPFIYSYQCSSELVRNYLAVYVIMYIYTAVIGPVCNFFMAFWWIQLPEERSNNIFSVAFTTFNNDDILLHSHAVSKFGGSADISHLSQVNMNGIELNPIRKLTIPNASNRNLNSTEPKSLPSPEPDSSQDQQQTKSNMKTSLISNSMRFSMFQYLSKRVMYVDKFVSKLVVDISVLVTFGFAYPPLGMIICVSILGGCFEWRLLTIRCLQIYEKCQEFRVQGFPKMRCDGIYDYFSRFQWILVTFMCWFVAFFVFDFSSGKVSKGSWVAIFLILWPLMLRSGSIVIRIIWPNFHISEYFIYSIKKITHPGGIYTEENAGAIFPQTSKNSLDTDPASPPLKRLLSATLSTCLNSEVDKTCSMEMVSISLELSPTLDSSSSVQANDIEKGSNSQDPISVEGAIVAGNAILQ